MASAPAACARFDERRVVDDRPGGVRILKHDGEEPLPIEFKRRLVADDHLDPERFRARPHHRDRLRMTALGNKDRPRLVVLVHRVRHVHRLGGGGRLVQERGIRDVERREIGDHLLEIDQRLHAPLGNLRLIGRVGRVPAGIFEDVPLDDRRHDAIAVSLANVAFENAVLRCHGAQLEQRLMFSEARREIQRRGRAQLRRGGGIDQGIQRRESPGSQASLRPRPRSIRDAAAEKYRRSEDRAGLVRTRSGRMRKRVVHRERLEMPPLKASGFDPEGRGLSGIGAKFVDSHPFAALAARIRAGREPFAQQLKARAKQGVELRQRNAKRRTVVGMILAGIEIENGE